MIEVCNLSKSYGAQKVLDQLSIDFAPGQVTGILGPNACGKTTLMKCLLGLVVADCGEIRIGGELIDSSGHFRKLMGYMPQNPNFPANLTVQEQLTMLEDLRRETAPLREELIELFTLGPSLKKSFAHLSGGTKQKVAAVCAFMFRPTIIILDEPTAGLDPVMSLRFKDLVHKTTTSTIVLVSHLLTEVQQLASQMFYLDEGKVVFSGPVDHSFKTASDLEKELAKRLEENF